MTHFLRRADASAYLRDEYGIRAAVGTLAKWASIGGGPRFHQDGRFPVYALDSLDSWAVERLGNAVRSTSDVQKAVAPCDHPQVGENRAKPLQAGGPLKSEIEDQMEAHKKGRNTARGEARP